MLGFWQEAAIAAALSAPLAPAALSALPADADQFPKEFDCLEMIPLDSFLCEDKVKREY